ncbi:nocturnin-like [Tubulanus polymorphus]|uniref:nocturnin-like n=1 Tax=Tubulanus polymorphus TaxID=672921 RepID=UPI003DA3C886
MDKNQSTSVDFTETYTNSQLLGSVKKILVNEASPLIRDFIHCNPAAVEQDKSAQQSQLIRVMQWNLLAQALCGADDNFVRCPPEALKWKSRKWKILREILTYDPDVIALQEVDHFDFLERALNSVGYSGTFEPKPDSPCLYVAGNDGPDGCALFYKRDKFEAVDRAFVTLAPDHPIANQVALCYKLRTVDDGYEFVVTTTHFKAKNGHDALRLLEAKHVVSYLKENYADLPLVICGDLNAPPSEDAYKYMMNNALLDLDSAYIKLKNDGAEPDYTTWKIRQEGKTERTSCKTIDYVFYSRERIVIKSLLKMSTDVEIGPDRLPSVKYPSDHFALVTDLVILSNSL